MKATYICRINEQVNRMKYGKTTAVFGFLFYKGVTAHLRAKGHHIRPLWRVLLDSGFDGDLMFEKKRDPWDLYLIIQLQCLKNGIPQTGVFTQKIKVIWNSYSLNSQI